MRKLCKLLLGALLLAAPVIALAAAYAATDSFDTYSNGDLTGNNGGSGFSAGWSGNAAYDVQSSITFNATTKAVSVAGVGTESITRAMSAGADSGNLYFAIRKDGNDDQLTFDFKSGATLAGGVGLTHNSSTGVDLIVYGTAAETFTGLAQNTWYIVNVELLSATTFRARYKPAGGAYSAFSSTKTYLSSVSSPSTVQLRYSNDGGANPTFYFDELCTSDPESSCTGTPAAAPAVPITSLVKAFWH